MINQQSTTCARSAFLGAAIAALLALAPVASLAAKAVERPAVSHLGGAADHHGRELLHPLWKLAVAGRQIGRLLLTMAGLAAGAIRSRSTRCGSRLSSGSGLYAFIGTDLF
jgi:hypothetical protein